MVRFCTAVSENLCECGFMCCVTKDEASFTPAELEKLQKALNMSASDVDDVIGACEFVFQQVRYCLLTV